MFTVTPAFFIQYHAMVFSGLGGASDSDVLNTFVDPLF
jgi:hypothetical protein